MYVNQQNKILDRYFRELYRLAQIDGLIRSDGFVATQEGIAQKLGLSDQTIRTDFDVLRALSAPLQSHGRHCWEYTTPWNLADAVAERIRSIICLEADVDH
jgi:DeoR/GlpR family transcriptional regulator of sugar metabolism